MLHNNTEVKLGKLSKTRKTDLLIKKLEKQDKDVVGCVNFTTFKFAVINYFVTWVTMSQ